MINRYRNIYEKLSDDISREIFEKRLMYSLTGDKSYVMSLGREYEKKVLASQQWLDFYEKLVSCKDNIVMYSAGYWGRELLLHTSDILWKCVIDKNPKDKEFCGIRAVAADDFFAGYNGETVVISSRVYYEEIREEMVNNGIPGDKIIDGAVLFDMSEGRQYFDLEQLPHLDEGEVFADVGCYDGLSAVYFDRWCKGKGFLYCFEPDRTNIERIRRVLNNKGVGSYELIEKGVWSHTGSIGFVSTGNSVSHISELNSEEDNTGSIIVTTLDEALAGKNVTFIKMDIEGAELEALKGAKSIICERKPKLAICVYHKPQDIWELPEIIMGFRDDYRFYLRHYSYQDNETVLYAI